MITKSALRMYANKQDSLSLYAKPEIAIPLKAIESVRRTIFDWNDDPRMEV